MSSQSAAIARQRAVEAALARNKQSSHPSSRHSDAAHSLTVFVVGCPGSGSTSQCAAIANNQSSHQSVDHVEFDRLVEHVIRLAEQKDKRKPSNIPYNGQSSNLSIERFTPSLSSSNWKTLLRCHERGEVMSSSIRARILYDWIDQSNKPSNIKPNTQKSHVYLVDGYLQSQEDWNEWAALIKKRAKEQAKAAAKPAGESSADDRPKLGFLPPVVVRLVCSESVGQLRWRRQVLVQNDANSSSGTQSFNQTINQIKARSMRYSLMTRPLIYRLGIQSQEVRRIGVDKSMHSSINQSIQDSVSQSNNPSTREDGESSSDSEPDEEVGLTLIDGTVVKRVDAECPIDQCFKLFENLISEILDVYYRTFNQENNRSGLIEHPWDEVEGFESDPEEEEQEPEVELPSVVEPASQPINQSINRPIDRTMDSQPGSVGLTIDSRLANVTLNQPINLDNDGDISPSVINWKDDPVEDLDSSDREFDEIMERNARLMKLIEQEEERWHKAQLREEVHETKKLEEQINRIKEKTNEVVAEPGHIPTRKDDRFVTFISFMISLTLQSIQNPKDDSTLMVEIFRGFEHKINRPSDDPTNNQIRWIPVVRTAPMPCPHTAGLTVSFPRVIANTWRLSGNERERPIMFRLVSVSQPNNQSVSTKTVLAETRTNLQHLISPPEAAGLTLAFSKYIPAGTQANNQPISSGPLGFVVCSRAALHTLLKASKIIPPEKLATLNQVRPVIPTAIPITPSNMVTPAHSNNASPVISPVTSPLVSPLTSPKARTSALSSPPLPEQSSNAPIDPAQSSRSHRSDRPTTRTRSSTAHNAERPPSSRHRSSQPSNNAADDEADRILRELDQQIGIGPRRAASFDGAQSSKEQAAGRTDSQSVDQSQHHSNQLPIMPAHQPMQAPANNALVPAPLGQDNASAPAESAEASHRRLARRKFRESKAEAERRKLVELRRKRAKAEAREMQARAIEREKRRTELARLKKKAAVQRVSMLAIESAALNLPKQGIFAHDRFYLQVYRKRDKIKEKERAAKAMRPSSSKKNSLSQPVDASGARADGRKMADTLPADARNYCIKTSHRHFLKPSLFSLVYSSPVYSSLNPVFAQFAVPIDDQPLVFVLVASSCTHKAGESARFVEHDGKDRIIGIARLAMSDMVNIAAIQQREWDVEIYAMVEREREKERARERAAAQSAASSGGADAFEELAEAEVIDAEKLAQKNRVSVILKEPKQLEREKEARAQRRAERKRRAGVSDTASSNADDDDSDDSGDEAGSTVADAAVHVPMLAFFAISFFSTRPIQANGGLVMWSAEDEAKRNELIREQRARVLGASSRQQPQQQEVSTVRLA